MTDDNIEYVANSSRAWGKGDYKTDALAKLAPYYRGDLPETIEIGITKVRGFRGMTGGGLSTWPDAAEVLAHTDYEIPRAEFKALRTHVRETDVLAEEALVEAESTEHELGETEGDE